MHETIELTASDGHRFALYQVLPSGAAKGSVLVIQEIFGVNAHIRELCHRYATAGYRAAAPAL
ncbi:MAG: dienelactone hydrolase family protein, partial [Pseudomonadales bacterium]|nr:dienelactone hydrolase family protein [Pseudomonadales bacterium]